MQLVEKMWCSGHQDHHPSSAFSPSLVRSGKASGYCIEFNRQYQKSPERYAWRRRNWLWKSYGLSEEGYLQLLSDQGGTCAICQKPPPKGKNLSVDHDHATGQVRGLLCAGCNFTVGHVERDKDIVRRVLSYLGIAAATFITVMMFATSTAQAKQATGLRAYAGYCLARIIDMEGGWNPRAQNRYSGAYGLPQALPGWKMASAGRDWRTNPVTQIRWMRRYVRARYGSECGALQFRLAHGWY